MAIFLYSLKKCLFGVFWEVGRVRSCEADAVAAAGAEKGLLYFS